MDLPPRRRSIGRLVALFGLVVSLHALGCGGSTGSVSGKVLYKDTPLKGGFVTFVTADNKSFKAEIGEDGSYSIVEKMPAGDVKISVETESLKPSPGARSYAPPADYKGDYKPPDSAAAAKRYIKIPDKYASADTSGLKLTIKGGKQEFDIKLD